MNFMKLIQHFSQNKLTLFFLFTDMLQKLVMICPYCNQIYKTRQNLTFHLRGVHKIGEPLKCGCGMDTFKSYTTYKRHRQACPQGEMRRNPRSKGSSEKDAT